MDELNYDALVPIIRERDGDTCAFKCGRGTTRLHFSVVRKKFWEADSLENLHVVCRWCKKAKDLD